MPSGHYPAPGPLNVIILFWLVINAKSLLLAVFFMLGRTNERLFYRFYVKLPVEMDAGGYSFQGTTSDLSEGGLSVILDYPAHIAAGSHLSLRLSDREYRAEMECKLVQVKGNQDGKWVYSLKLENIDENSLSNYRQMIYERDPSLPESINETLPVIEDIKINLDKRLTAPNNFISRQLPRLWKKTDGLLDDGTLVSLNDFSYHYVRTAPAIELGPEDTVRVTVEPGVELILAAPEKHLAANNVNLYQVLNWRDWAEKDIYVAALARWVGTKKPALRGTNSKWAFSETSSGADSRPASSRESYGPSSINSLINTPAVGSA